MYVYIYIYIHIAIRQVVARVRDDGGANGAEHANGNNRDMSDKRCIIYNNCMGTCYCGSNTTTSSNNCNTNNWLRILADCVADTKTHECTSHIARMIAHVCS